MRWTCVCYSKSYWHVSAFSPAVVSTPYTHIHTSSSPQQNLSLNTTEPTVGTGSMQYSHRHNGLYLYVGRLVRPVWNLRIVTRETVDKVQFVSTLDVNWYWLLFCLYIMCVQDSYFCLKMASCLFTWLLYPVLKNGSEIYSVGSFFN
jgi:hypothetical protein